jgi:hypothetical protein
MEIHDDPVNNCFTTVLSYEIRDCWKQMEKPRTLSVTFVDNLLPGELALLKQLQRRSDIYLGRPRKMTRRICISMPRKWSGEGWQHNQEAPGLGFSDRVVIEGRTITGSRELTVETWSLPAQEATAYADVTRKLQENVLIISARERFGKIRSVAGPAWGFNAQTAWVIFVLIWLLASAIARLVADLSR